MCVTVENMQREVVPYVLNPAQEVLEANWPKGDRQIVLKPRRVGSTMYYLVRMLHQICTAEGTLGAVIMHRGDVTKRTLSIFRGMWDRLPPWVKPEVGNDSGDMLTFPGRRAQVFIGTAGAKGSFGHGDTLHYALCSEVAKWEDADRNMAAIVPTVPEKGGFLVKDSTSAGPGGHFYESWKEAKEPGSRYVASFIHWWTCPDYRAGRDDRLDDIEPLWEDEAERIATGALRPSQVRWKRYRIKDMCPEDYEEGGAGHVMFLQQYPQDDVTAFMGIVGRPFFPPQLLAKLESECERGHRVSRARFLRADADDSGDGPDGDEPRPVLERAAAL